VATGRSTHLAKARSEPVLRRTGIRAIGDLPWGAHMCLFYETPQDLLDIHVAYFRAGLEDGEYGLWALSDPVSRTDAINALDAGIPNFGRYLDDGAIELIPGYEWYLQGEEFDSQRVTGGWRAKHEDAMHRGFAGLRASGNAFWIESNQWPTFREYEEELDRSIEGREMLVLCTYSLGASRAVDVMDVARCHNVSIARRHGDWEFLETPELLRARREIKRLNGAIEILSNKFPGHDKLTQRERIILAQIAKGASSKEAGRALGISPRTVEFHRANIMRKLSARNVAELLNKVIGAG
jgi:DNA-binding CsgD family transcriptional regulator